MTRPPRKSHFPVSLYATPNPSHQEVFYTVPRAGHLVGGPDHRVSRNHFPGHELILCLRGRGYVRVAARSHAVQAGDLVWINCHRPHEHGAIEVDPWEVFWIRTEGPRLEAMCNILAIQTHPVIPGVDAGAARSCFEEIFVLMRSGAPSAPASIHAAVARLLAIVFAARQPPGDQGPVVPAPLLQPVQQMRLFYFERHTVASLARRAGMSPSHFSRRFRAVFGTSPIDWLRRERINQAKRRLAETTAGIAEIADQVGYHDRYFFSKDFKRHTGLTPREFRRRESSQG